MKYTNRLELPDAICEAVKRDTYSKGDSDISITGLLRPPRMAVLESLRKDELEEDVSDRIWSLMGQSIHSILERANKKGIAERRLSMKVAGWTVSGGMDLFDEKGVLTDYKVTSVWHVIKGVDRDWERQMNLYRVLLEHHGHSVKSLQIVALLRDWSKNKAKDDPSYPQAQVVNIAIPLWPRHESFSFMEERVVAHQKARIELPGCSPEDRWTRPDVYAVMKVGRKSALRLYDNLHSASEHAAREGASVVKRPGEDVRCNAYCSVSKWCTQYQQSKKGIE